MREISVHRLGHVMGTHIAKKIDKPDKAAYLGYGAEIILGSIIKLGLLFFTAFMLDIIIEVLIILVITGVIRTLSGGAHCSAYYRCLITSIFVLSALGYTIKVIYPFISQLPTVVLLGITMLNIFLYWYYAPQAPPNKPFKSKTVEIAFRRYTLISILIPSLIPFVLGTESLYSWLIVSALLWQGFTLTPAGHWFIDFFDVLLKSKKKEVKHNVEAHF